MMCRPASSGLLVRARKAVQLEAVQSTLQHSTLRVRTPLLIHKALNHPVTAVVLKRFYSPLRRVLLTARFQASIPLVRSTIEGGNGVRFDRIKGDFRGKTKQFPLTRSLRFIP